ncbi:type II toxin-antitoxin system HicB family antitoxin [Ktedonosporobacter rubrisoli]|uniref:Type II toxin-antitoxin system HicB family antitoxin n=1 Tax=Ktedonosporobacter rubrisoli TaxID=2509675 RepID=A0A4P6K1T0_KTERU|nr:type II toxin-antitoxin system HicB family antitoxin [Ktedonosporobacter rubrisoli]
MKRPFHYSIIIQWSDRDQAYLVNVPELPGCHTHGDTYEEALKNALEVIELWIEAAIKDGRPVPPPKVLAAI